MTNARPVRRHLCIITNNFHKITVLAFTKGCRFLFSLKMSSFYNNDKDGKVINFAWNFEHTKTSRKPADTLFLFILGNSTGPEMLSLKSGESTVLAFTLEERDIGGTLAVELALISHRVTI